MELILVAVIAVALVTAGTVIALLRRRMASSSGLARRSAPELSAEEVAWRIGASTLRPAPKPAPGPDPRAVAGPAPVPTVPAVVAAGVHRSGHADPLVSTRRQLARDSATVLLAACLALLAVTTFVPPQGPGPAEGPADVPTEVALPSAVPLPMSTAATGPLPEPTGGGVAGATSQPITVPTVTRTPGLTATRAPTPTRGAPGPAPTPSTPTPAPVGPTPTPVPTPEPTPEPTPVQTSEPTPDPTPEPTPSN